MASKKRGIVTEEGSELLGERLEQLRKERGITQVEMAAKLGISQPVISKYERGELRLHGELIVKVAQILHVSTDELLGLQKAHQRSSVDPRILRRIKDIDRLSKRDRDALMRTIDAFLSRT